MSPCAQEIVLRNLFHSSDLVAVHAYRALKGSVGVCELFEGLGAARAYKWLSTGWIKDDTAQAGETEPRAAAKRSTRVTASETASPMLAAARSAIMRQIQKRR